MSPSAISTTCFPPLMLPLFKRMLEATFEVSKESGLPDSMCAVSLASITAALLILPLDNTVTFSAIIRVLPPNSVSPLVELYTELPA